MTSISATKYMNEKIRRVTPNGRVEDETIKGDAVGLHRLMHNREDDADLHARPYM